MANQFDDRPVAEQSWAFQNAIGADKDHSPRRKPRFVSFSVDGASVNVNRLDKSILVDCTGGAVTLVLPDTVGHDDESHIFKKIDASANGMTVDGLGSQTVEGAANVSTTTQGITFMVWSDGSNWRSVVLQPGTVSSGGVTSVGLALPASVFDVTVTPITSAGTLTAVFDTQNPNTVFAGPTGGGAATPAFRALVTADMPSGTGTVTSVALSLPNNDVLTVSGSPVTTTGTLTATPVDPAADRIIIWDDSAGKWVYASVAGNVTIDGTVIRGLQWLGYRLCHKDTALATGELETDWPPFGFTLLSVAAHVDTVSSSGTPTFDIKENGTTMLSTLITVDASENTSTGAATPPVISDTTFTLGNKLSLHCTVTGTGTKGAMVKLLVLPT